MMSGERRLSLDVPFPDHSVMAQPAPFGLQISISAFGQIYGHLGNKYLANLKRCFWSKESRRSGRECERHCSVAEHQRPSLSASACRCDLTRSVHPVHPAPAVRASSSEHPQTVHLKLTPSCLKPLLSGILSQRQVTRQSLPKLI